LAMAAGMSTARLLPLFTILTFMGGAC
jgi:hypothetical protein